MMQELIHNSPGSRTPVCVDAFSSDVVRVWQNMEVSGLNRNIYDMCYNRSLAAFLRDGREAAEERRRLLFSYLRASGFAAGRPTDGINRHYPSLPTDNLYVKRVIKNLCTNYLNSPDREPLEAG